MLLTLVIVYLLVTIAIGLMAAKRVQNSSDFAIAGRHLPMAMIVTTTFATWFGSETVLGVSAKFVQGGLGMLSLTPMVQLPEEVKLFSLANLLELWSIDRARNAITSIGDGMGLPITAEGIESPEIVEALRKYGAFKGQGYLYGMPEPADETHERLAELDRLPVLHQDLLHDAGLVRLDLVHELHRFDDAERVPRLHGVADLDERFGARRRSPIERADHRRLDRDETARVPRRLAGRLGGARRVPATRRVPPVRRHRGATR